MERTVSANGLAADAQLQKNRFVALWARISQVSQKPATLGNQGQQPLAGAMILLVRLEMLRQHRDSGAQQGNLYFWRPGVGLVALIPGENLLLGFNRQCHSRGNAPCLLLISLWYVHQNTTGGRAKKGTDAFSAEPAARGQYTWKQKTRLEPSALNAYSPGSRLASTSRR